MDAQAEISKTASKSFWARPEGKTGLLFTAAAIGAAGFGLYHFLPFLITLLENTLYAGVLGAAVLVLSSPIWSSKVRTLTSYFFKSAMRKITGFFVEIDPIGILKNYIEEIKGNLSTMDKQIGNLRGHIQRLTGIIEKNTADVQQNLARAAVAKRENQKSALVLSSRQAGRLEKSNLSLAALKSKMETLYKMLAKLREVSAITAADMESEVEVKEQEYNAINAGYGAFTSAMKVLAGSSDGKQMYEQAMEHLADNYASKVGEIENSMNLFEGFIASVDLDNLVFEESALAKLEELEKSTDLFGTPAGVSQFEEQQSAVQSLYR